jgi:hypothetical protein
VNAAIYVQFTACGGNICPRRVVRICAYVYDAELKGRIGLTYIRDPVSRHMRVALRHTPAGGSSMPQKATIKSSV